MCSLPSVSSTGSDVFAGRVRVLSVDADAGVRTGAGV
jgi:hypothetical protein